MPNENLAAVVNSSLVNSFGQEFYERMTFELETLSGLKAGISTESGQAIAFAQMSNIAYATAPSQNARDQITISLARRICEELVDLEDENGGVADLLARLFVRACFIREILVEPNTKYYFFSEEVYRAFDDENFNYVEENAKNFKGLSCGLPPSGESDVFSDLRNAITPSTQKVVDDLHKVLTLFPVKGPDK
jgi:hypothetical protein